MEDTNTIIRSNDPANPWVLAGFTPALTGIQCRRFTLKYSFVKHAGHYAVIFTYLFQLSKSLR